MNIRIIDDRPARVVQLFVVFASVKPSMRSSFQPIGYLRSRTGGLMAPVVAHILADLVIGYILLVTQIKA